jgi:hypothetical protein
MTNNPQIVSHSRTKAAKGRSSLGADGGFITGLTDKTTFS